MPDESLDRLAVKLAAAGGALPQRREPFLRPSPPAVVAHVLEEPKFPARPQDAGEFVQRGVGIRDGTEDQTRERDIESVVDVRERLGAVVAEVDAQVGSGGDVGRPASHVGVRFDRVVLEALVRSVGRVGNHRTVARAEVEDAPGEVGGEVLAVESDQKPIRHEPVVERRKYRVFDPPLAHRPP